MIQIVEIALMQPILNFLLVNLLETFLFVVDEYLALLLAMLLGVVGQPLQRHNALHVVEG
jgi:hypothetical protein